MADERKDDGSAVRLIDVEKPITRRRRPLVVVKRAERFSTTITDRMACCARHWAYSVALALDSEVDLVLSFGASGEVALVEPNDKDPDAFDEWLLSRMQTGLFAVTCALFVMQNRYCYTPIRLWHIVQSLDWTHYFCKLVGLVHRETHTSDVDEWKAVTEWLSKRPSTIARDVPVKSFDVVLSSVALAKEDFTLRLVRDALQSATLTEPQLEAFIEHQALRHATRARLTSRRHAQVQLARLIRLRQARRSVKHTKQLERTIESVHQWLTNFLVMGCACKK